MAETVRTSGENDYERTLLANIEEHGWQRTCVGAGEGSPAFTYTIGLYASFGHPELLILSLPFEVTQAMCEIVADAAREGIPIDPSKSNDRLLNDYETYLVDVARASYEEYVLSALWFYEDESFPVFQVVWPSYPDGIFPWEPEADEEFLRLQPLLGAPPSTG